MHSFPARQSRPKPLSDFVFFAVETSVQVFRLALVRDALAVAARETAVRRVQDGVTPAAPGAREPDSCTPEITVCSEKGDALAARFEAHRMVHAYRAWRDGNPGAGRYFARRRGFPSYSSDGTICERTGAMQASHVERVIQFGNVFPTGAAWAEFPIGHLFNFEIIWQVFRAALLSHRTINIGSPLSECPKCPKWVLQTFGRSGCQMSECPTDL